MHKLGWIASAAAMAALGGCVVISKDTERRTYDMADFDSISATSGINVVLRQGPFAVSAEAPKGELDRITIEKSGSTLVLGHKPQIVWFGWSGPSIVTVVAPDYSAIDATGGADIDIDPLKADVLRISANGGADINAGGLTLDRLDVSARGGGDISVKNVTLDTIQASVSGGGGLRLAGSCKTAMVEASSGGDFGGRNLKCENATATASGGADIDVAVTGSAKGSASAGGDIKFRGNPTNLVKEESGGGDVNSGL